MSIFEKCLNTSQGARFYRADMHIHSFGSSQDVTDTTMTPKNIVAAAIKVNLDVISITDHNEINNVEASIEAAKDKALLVIPGVELSTPQGHLLCYLPSLEALQQFHGRLNFADRGTQNSRCQNSILDCLNMTDDLEGFGVLAHVDGGSGFEQVNPGASPHKVDVLCHRSLLGIELKSASSQISYADTDPEPHRVGIGRERINTLRLGSKQFLARVLNSDAHSLVALGHNAAGEQKVTRIKVDIPSFAAIRIALEDSDARIRIEDMIPHSVPAVLGIQLEGGFLADQVIHFSRNLNCIIGGRGAGKSTTFEGVRCLSGNPSGNPVIDSEVWPSQLLLLWEDAAGQRHKLSRSTGGEIENIDHPNNGPISFEIDCFGQGETAKISEQAKTDPLALLKYLDRFVTLTDAVEAEEQSREKLLELQTQIEKAVQQVELIPQYERALDTTKKQLEALEKANAKDVIELQRRVATEREIRTLIVEKMEVLEGGILRTSSKETVEEIMRIADPTSLAIGVTEFSSIVTSASELAKDTDVTDEQMKVSFNKFSQAAKKQLGAWKVKDSEAQKKIDLKRKELEDQGIRLDMAYVQKLATDEASQKQTVEKLRGWKPVLRKLNASRVKALKERWRAREHVATIRDTYARSASQTLKEALSDLQVSLKYVRNGYSPDGERHIIQAMGWKTVQQTRAAALVEKLTIPKLLEAIKKKDDGAITNLKTKEGVSIFKKSEAINILERLCQPQTKFALERCELFDLPQLQVTKIITVEGGTPRAITRGFAQLSLGQQQSVLLALILSSNSNHPLIIDQPEDNLDSEFIYHSLVPVLRRAKERRQIIIVTHNANVAVLGDAELIVVLKSTSEKATIVARGSIDHIETRDAACNILEGAKEAFLRRAKIYGVNAS